MAATARETKKTTPRRSGALSRQDWIEAARQVLITDGIERVKVEPLAEKLRLSRGSFYWHFKNHQDLLDALLAQWKETALEPMSAVAEDRSLGPVERYEKFWRVWVRGEPHCPVYDLAIRRWALVDPGVARLVKRTDQARIKMLTSIFSEMGHPPEEAMVRARIAYFHQIGYYAANMRESDRKRSELWPLYVKILAGRTAGDK